MREILFKAKTTKKSDPNHALNETWVTGNLIITNEKYYIHPVGAIGNVIVIHEIQPDTLCQYTGLTDKDGNKIWENDIVGFYDYFSTESGYSEQDCLGLVEWLKDEVCFNVTNRISAEVYEVLEDCTVVGNKFDNPELCEEV